MSTVERSSFDAVIVGGGPRGVATVLRTATRVAVAGTSPVRLAVIDALAVGPGATWLIDRPGSTSTTQATPPRVHPDASTRMSGPPVPRPDLVDWARRVLRTAAIRRRLVLEEAAARPAPASPAGASRALRDR